MTQDHLTLMRQRLEGIMSFMQLNAQEFFLPAADYVPPGDATAEAAGFCGLAPQQQQQQQVEEDGEVQALGAMAAAGGS